MSSFTEKASAKLQKLSTEEIRRILENQSKELSIRNTVLSNCIDGYIVVNSHEKVMFINEAATYLVSVTATFKNNIALSKLISDNDIRMFMHNVVIQKKQKDEQLFFVSENGKGERSVNIVSSYDNKIQAFIFFIRDVTLFKRFKEQYKKNESLAALTTMAAGVAHEIKNPLASISIYLQMLQMKLDKNGILTREDTQKSLDIMKDEIDRINRIAIDFNFAVKPMNAIMENININDVIDKTSELFGVELSSQNTKLIVNKASSLPKIHADKALVEQALLNLLKNAQQAISSANREGEIIISSFVDDDMVKLSVSDNGCGMTESQRNRIFEPYFTTKETGTGLGLTLLFKIMKEHDGDIFVESKEGIGSVFTLQFPIPQNERFKIE